MTPAELLLGLVLTGTQSHYEHRGLIDDKRLEHLLLAGKQILYKSHQESDVRQALGFSPKVWQGLTDVLSSAIPVLEQQSFAWKNPASAGFKNSCSAVVNAHYLPLVKDIERLNDLCTIARNLLATTKKAQNLAAEKSFDQQILRLIEVCTKSTARGYDGEPSTRDEIRGYDGAKNRNEERWHKVVNLYKRLLITCLQFLHNFIMHNEHRKLVLWLDLFGNSQAAENEGQLAKDETIEDDATLATIKTRLQATVEKLPEGDKLTANGGLGYNIDDVHALFDLMSMSKEPDNRTQEAAKVLMDKIRTDMERLSGLSANQLDDNPEALLKVGAALRAQLPAKMSPSDIASAQTQENPQRKGLVNVQKPNGVSQTKATNWSNLPDLSSYADISTANQEITDEDLSMPRTSQSAAETLQEAKDELMTRLQDAVPVVDENGDPAYDDEGEVPDDGIVEDDIIDSAEGSLEDEDDDDDEDEDEEADLERGLLTDVPLVLGPNEIEALPMIIQAGIVDNFGMKNGDRQGVKNMQAVRCHILLAQEAGRNVLRELLIFIAAWDLPDDEFYFKMMVQIMEAILKNGLMSHAYSDFGQAKDIISPAQAVVIKILTHIFRAKYSPASVVQNANDQTPSKPRVPAPLSRVDVLTVRYIFTVFRGNIIPETCALIYLQGQIRAGLALAEDFPLNLWDMERVYEGVYQFLEFFAVLTENNDWKRLLVEWEIVYDLVTLIKELDASIPKPTLVKGTLLPRSKDTNASGRGSRSSSTSQTASQAPSPVPVAVERPYEADPDDEPAPRPSTTTTTGELDTTLPSSPPPRDSSSSPQIMIPDFNEEPADFEWRNLKKLIVLVLSSLVWKSPTVQNQIRLHGGVETILSCTQHDTNNPYIKEHAVMCLKFLLEGNKENQELVGGLEAREVAGGQGVDDLKGVGVEVGLDENGKVRLVRDRTPTNAKGTNARRASDGGSSNSAGDKISASRFVTPAMLKGGFGGGARHQQEIGMVIGEEERDLDDDDDDH